MKRKSITAMCIVAAGRAKTSEKQSLRPKKWTFAQRMGEMVESILLPALMAKKKREENCKLDVG